MRALCGAKTEKGHLLPGSGLHANHERGGEDVSERLDIVPAQFRVIVTRRPKYACRDYEAGIVQAPAKPRLIEGGMSRCTAGYCAAMS